jgi:hypothetical protein
VNWAEKRALRFYTGPRTSRLRKKSISPTTSPYSSTPQPPADAAPCGARSCDGRVRACGCARHHQRRRVHPGGARHGELRPKRGAAATSRSARPLLQRPGSQRRTLPSATECVALRSRFAPGSHGTLWILLQGSLHSTTENGVYSFDDQIVCGKGTLAVQIEHELYYFPVDLRSNKADIGQNLHVRHDMRRRRKASEPCGAKAPPPVEPAPPLRHDVVLSYDDPQSAATASLVTAGCFLLGSSIWLSRRRHRARLKSVASRGTLTCFGGRRGYWQVRSLQIAWVKPLLWRRQAVSLLGRPGAGVATMARSSSLPVEPRAR